MNPDWRVEKLVVVLVAGSQCLQFFYLKVTVLVHYLNIFCSCLVPGTQSTIEFRVTSYKCNQPFYCENLPDFTRIRELTQLYPSIVAYILK